MLSVGAIFMDLSKAFDTLNHDLLIAKLEAFGFSENSLNYIQSYLRNRCSVMVYWLSLLHKSELRFCAGSNPARGESEIRNCENL